MQPGETQTITVESTPRYHVVVGTIWPDQEPHSEWGGSSIGSRIGKDGTYTIAFLIPPTAPRGAAVSDAAVNGIVDNVSYQGSARTYWEIASSC